ncbi:hypothetical protein PR048_007003, partial [Dryococelus australis]
MNLTLMNKVRTKFAETDRPHTLWGESVRASAYKLNRSPTSALQDRIPDSVQFGLYAEVTTREQTGTPCEINDNGRIFSGGCRLWDSLNDKIVDSRDVTFNESKVGVGNDTAQYQGINIEEENEHLNRKDSTEAKTDTEENGTKDLTKHGTPQQSSEESDEEFIGFEDLGEKNHRNKPNRTVKMPSHLQEYELYMAYCLCAGEPQAYEGAIKLGNQWEEAIESEINALELHQTWTPRVLPPGEKAIEPKWIFKTKKEGKINRKKKGVQEEPANNVYAPVARLPTIRLLISIAVTRKWEIRQLDIPTAVLNGYMDDDIYIKTLDGVKNEPGMLKLKISLYGLCSALRKWNERFHNFMETHGMKRSASDFCLYIGENEKNTSIKLIRFLKGEFKAKDLGILSAFLGTMVVYDGDEVKISQVSFINKILSKFNIILCKGVNTPMVCDFQVGTEEPVNEKFMFWQQIGSLMYVATVSWPEILYSVCYLSRFLNKPTEQLWKAGKRVLRYLHSDDKLVCYSDSDWAGDKHDRKSVSGCVLLQGKNSISWGSRKQGIVALSTAEAEYIACATAAFYLQGVVQDFQSATSTPVLLTDNQSAIDMAEGFENSRRSHHIDIKFHYLKDLVDKKRIKINY